jgi:hypothetical protein
VDFVYLPNAPHLLVKPRERLTAEQDLVDWFCFWLKGEKNDNPGRVEQYRRWQRLKSEAAH